MTRDRDPDRATEGASASSRILTFDLGQGGLRARLRSGSDLECEFTGPGYLPGQPIAQFLLDLAERAAQASGSRRFDTLAGGLTGVHGHPPDPHDFLPPLKERFGTRRLVLADDALTSYLGARGNHEGVIAAVGTGLVALGYAPRKRAARVDGAGAMVGDEGSGWWVGRQGLIAAISASDGRRPSSKALLAAVEELYGPVGALPTLIAAAPSPIALVASFAPAVAQAAREGDDVARRIWARAGEHIAAAISAAARGAGLGPRCDYTLLGGIAAAIDLLEPTLSRRLQDDLPGATRTAPVGTSLDGAERLVALDTLEPLSPLATETTQA
ncbi:N-acetylglucosamine kinase [Sinomonas humi]|uniref:N-acetylglucosamine kinase n=1 Tax=Sinomonas humi TaxID=1338436 RepID=UPI00068B03FA|nr:BadF/BadG/BcrA/BcrD ATPase family protein [Sinomonas humi]